MRRRWRLGETPSAAGAVGLVGVAVLLLLSRSIVDATATASTGSDSVGVEEGPTPMIVALRPAVRKNRSTE